VREHEVEILNVFRVCRHLDCSLLAACCAFVVELCCRAAVLRVLESVAVAMESKREGQLSLKSPALIEEKAAFYNA